MQKDMLRGKITQLALPDVLEFLKVSRKTGKLVLRREGVEKFLLIEAGNVIFAGSGLPEDRLGDMLLRQRKINRTQYDISVRRLAESEGKRQGRILVEISALAPQELWAVVREQIRSIVYSLFDWEEGEFFFEAHPLSDDERIVVDVSITELIIEGVRRIENRRVIEGWSPDEAVVFCLTLPKRLPVSFQKQEQSILDLVDGKRTLSQIIEDGDIERFETLKVLYMLSSAGFLTVKTDSVPVPETTSGEKQADDALSTLWTAYNETFAVQYRYLLRELGPMASHVFEKYLRELREELSDGLLDGVFMTRNGRLSDFPLLRKRLDAQHGQTKDLEAALKRLYERQVRGITRILGPEHARHLAHTLHAAGKADTSAPPRRGRV